MMSVLLPLILASTILATPLARQNTRQYTVYNKCPMAIDLYISGEKHGIIPTNGNLTKSLGTGVDYFYTDANDGNQNAQGTIQAGFTTDYYFMVSDLNHVNTGVQVKPRQSSPNSGFCETIECEGRGCPQAFSQRPTKFPTPASSPPSPPYYQCPNATDYDITFCPNGVFPDQRQLAIHFGNSPNKCLDVRGEVSDFANGTPVQIYDCNSTAQAQRWIMKSGSTKVQLADTKFCLDAGAHPANGVQLKIWECYDGLPAQQWFYTSDKRIKLENQGFCVDLENGAASNSHKVQTWTCSDNNPNQVWT